MTTIVYDHKNRQIAVDSRMTKNSGFYNDCFDKIKFKGSLLFAMCGSTCDLDYFIDNYEKYKRTGLDDAILDCSGIMVRDGKVYNVFVHEDIFNEDVLICNEAYGSGAQLALAALDFGCSAKDAVEYAATRDIYTGGKVHVFNLDSMTFECH